MGKVAEESCPNGEHEKRRKNTRDGDTQEADSSISHISEGMGGC
jgi:hypothetical protein